MVFAIGCHAEVKQESRPLPSHPERINDAMRMWGYALRYNDDANWQKRDDAAGRFALGYGGIKLLASEVPDGAEAVEQTIMGIFWQAFVQAWRNEPGPPEQWGLVVPNGTLGRALVDAGFATENKHDARFAIVPLPWEETLGRMEEASKQHKQRLRERQAWSCRPNELLRTVLPTDATLQRAALVSSHIFAWWLEDVDAIWVVRATCTTGPALFIVTGHVDQKTGYANDKVLLAKLTLH